MKTESNEQQNNEMVNEGRKECILRLDDPQQYSALDAKNDESLRHDAELSESSPGAHEGSVVTTTTITALPSSRSHNATIFFSRTFEWLRVNRRKGSKFVGNG